MTNYMKKTKKELVNMLRLLKAENSELRTTPDMEPDEEHNSDNINEISLELEKLKALNEVREEEIENLKKLLSDTELRLKSSNKNFGAAINLCGSTKKEVLANENAKLQSEMEYLKSAYEKLKGDHSDLLNETKGLSEKLAETDDRLVEAEKMLNNQAETLSAMKRYYELFTCLMEGSSNRYVFLDASYDIRYINQNARDYLGVSGNGSIIGRSFFDFIREKDAPFVKKALSKAIFKGEDEKIKASACLSSQRKSLKMKVKISRIQCYQDPSVMIVLK